MGTFKVLAAQEARQLPPKGDFPPSSVDHYTLDNNGTECLVTAFRRQSNPLPAIGDTIEGEIGEPDKFDANRRKFTKARSGGGGPRKRDPDETRRIQRQHQTAMALQYIGHKITLGKIEDFTFEDVTKLTDAFMKDLDGPVPLSDVPFDSTNLA